MTGFIGLSAGRAKMAWDRMTDSDVAFVAERMALLTGKGTPAEWVVTVVATFEFPSESVDHYRAQLELANQQINWVLAQAWELEQSHLPEDRDYHYRRELQRLESVQFMAWVWIECLTRAPGQRQWDNAPRTEDNPLWQAKQAEMLARLEAVLIQLKPKEKPSVQLPLFELA